MISVKAAEDILLKQVKLVPTQLIPLSDAYRRILREPVQADRDFPPFDRVTMDGIAITWSEWETGRRSFLVQDVQLAGMPPLKCHHPAACLEVMTGSILPANTDTVIPYEQVKIENDGVDRVAVLGNDQVKLGQNVHQKGFDRIGGSLLISPGVKMTASEIAVASTVGKARITVAKLPRIAIISTGDELVSVEDQPAPYQIRQSNAAMIRAALRDLGILAETFHLNDSKQALKSALGQILEGFDHLILSGGVSKGKADYVPEVLDELGVEKLFHRVKQRPGKPFWLGKMGQDKMVFALPGNPVSTLVCLYKYFIPWLRKCLGAVPCQILKAQLDRDFKFGPDLTYFLQVKLTIQDKGTILAQPVPGKGSGDLANLLESDGLMELPAKTDHFRKGEAFPVFLFRDWPVR
ncbi:MAG: molybdopterin molybdotransferase MoeA [Candidatus Cyclobacteriaceae bacterium M3_2C_046]